MPSEEFNKKHISDKRQLLGRKFYHGTTLETWKNSPSRDYLFISDEFEVAKRHAQDRAESSNNPSTAIVVEVVIDDEILSLDWEVDDDLGNWSRPPLNFKTWQDSFNAVGSFVIVGEYDINKFKIVFSEKKNNTQSMHEVEIRKIVRQIIREALSKSSESMINNILDKISQTGIQSLSNYERDILDRVSKGGTTDPQTPHQAALDYLSRNFSDLTPRQTTRRTTTGEVEEVFWHKNSTVYMVQEIRVRIHGVWRGSNVVYLDYLSFWSPLYREFGIEIQEARQILIEWLDSQYGISGVNPRALNP